MATVDGRLSALTRTLTAQERAVLNLRRWKLNATVKEDWRLSHLMPIDEDPEYDRIMQSLADVTDRLNFIVPLWEQAVLDVDRRTAWAETLLAWQTHCDALSARLKTAKVKPSTTPLGLCTHGVTPAGEVPEGRDHNADPPPIQDLPAILFAQVALDVAGLLPDIEAMHIVIAEMSDAEVGGECVAHPAFVNVLERCESVLLTTEHRLQAHGVDIVNQTLSEDRLEKVRKALRWKRPAVMETAKEQRMPSRWSLTPEQKERLVALEHFLAESGDVVS